MATGKEAILQLLIDDGNPNRSQRECLFNPSMTKIGTFPAIHRIFKMCIVIVLCQEFLEQGRKDPISMQCDSFMAEQNNFNNMPEHYASFSDKRELRVEGK